MTWLLLPPAASSGPSHLQPRHRGGAVAAEPEGEHQRLGECRPNAGLSHEFRHEQPVLGQRLLRAAALTGTLVQLPAALVVFWHIPVGFLSPAGSAGDPAAPRALVSGESVGIVSLSSRAAAGGIKPQLLTLNFLSACRFRNDVACSVTCQLGFTFTSSRLVVPAQVVTNKIKPPPFSRRFLTSGKAITVSPPPPQGCAAPRGAGFGQFCPRPVSPCVLPVLGCRRGVLGGMSTFTDSFCSSGPRETDAAARCRLHRRCRHPRAPHLVR